MEWVIVGFLAVIYFNIKDKFDALEKKIARIKNNRVGESEMSNILKGLVGQKCKIDIKGNEFLGTVPECEVEDVDEVWVKVSIEDKKKGKKIKIVRIDDIYNIELTEYIK